MAIRTGDIVKCVVSVIDKQGKEDSYLAQGVCYHIGESVLAFEGTDGRIYGVYKDQVELA
jgi:hypothetical protein